MKSLIFLMAFFVCSAAQAVILNSWERPILNSTQDEIRTKSGIFAEVTKVSVSLTKRDQSPIETGILLVVNDELYENFQVMSKSHDLCGNTIFGGYGTMVDGVEKFIFIVDHATNHCPSQQYLHRWDVRVVFRHLGPPVKVLGVLELDADPRAIMTPLRSGKNNIKRELHDLSKTLGKASAGLEDAPETSGVFIRF